MPDLDPRDRWIDAALEALTREGLAGVRIEALARHLRVTKGSFYWHFRDRGDLLTAMMARWERTATQALIDQADAAGGSAQARLRALFRLASVEFRVQFETALRAWARHDLGVRRAVTRIDRRRLKYLETLFGELGLQPGDARAHAFLSYSMLFGTQLILGAWPRQQRDVFGRCRALLKLGPARGAPRGSSRSR